MNKFFGAMCAAVFSIGLAGTASAATVYAGPVDTYDVTTSYIFKTAVTDIDVRTGLVSTPPGPQPNPAQDYTLFFSSIATLRYDFSHTAQEFTILINLSRTALNTPLLFDFAPKSFLPDINVPVYDDIIITDVALDRVSFGPLTTPATSTTDPSVTQIQDLVTELSFTNRNIFLEIAGFSDAFTSGAPSNLLSFTFTYEAHAIPVPAALPLLAGGVGALAFVRRRRKKVVAA